MKTVIEMAREAGLERDGYWEFDMRRLERFVELVREEALAEQPAVQQKPLANGLDVQGLNHCMIAVRDWLQGGCDTHDIPRPEIAALVAFTAHGIKENT